MELDLVEGLVGLDTMEHSLAESAHLALLELAVAIDINFGEKFLSHLSEMFFGYLSHFKVPLDFILIIIRNEIAVVTSNI